MRRVWAATVLLSLGACAVAKPPPAPEAIETGPLAFLQDGRTPREKVLLELGDPASSFEDGRLITYRLVWTPEGEFRSIGVLETTHAPLGGLNGWGRYSLVLVFDAGGILQRHRLLRTL